MKAIGKSSIFIALLVAAAVLFAGCGGGGGSSSGGGGLTISGVITDENNSVVAGATVTLRRADHSPASTATSSASGSYTLSNVPASTELYINVSKTSYASTNTEIVSVTASVSNADLMIITNTSAKQAADAYNGSTGGAVWTDPFYAGKSWFFLITEDAIGNPAIGVTVSAAPSGPAILYNNGTDNYSTTGPTQGATNLPDVGGHNSTTGVYTFMLTKSTTTYVVKLPLVLGEFSGTWAGPF